MLNCTRNLRGPSECSGNAYHVDDFGLRATTERTERTCRVRPDRILLLRCPMECTAALRLGLLLRHRGDNGCIEVSPDRDRVEWRCVCERERSEVWPLPVGERRRRRSLVTRGMHTEIKMVRAGPARLPGT